MHRFLGADTRAVLFDVDGTLYNKARLRTRMAWLLTGQLLRNAGNLPLLPITSRGRPDRIGLRPLGVSRASQPPGGSLILMGKPNNITFINTTRAEIAVYTEATAACAEGQLHRAARCRLTG